MVDAPEDIDAADFLGVSEADVPETIRLHSILTNEEYKAAQAKAREKLDKERRQSAFRDVEERETVRLRNEEGLTSGITSEDELVSIVIDVPDWVPWCSINGIAYHHGHTYSVPRHVYRSLMEQMQNCQRTNDLADGKSTMDMYRARRHNVLDGKAMGHA
jgi:hypothetical protein